MQTRRTFIKNTGVVATACGCAGATALLNSCGYGRYAQQFTETTDTISVPKTELGEDPFVLIKTEKMKAPILLARQNPEGFKALNLLCTHKSCVVKPQGKMLVCPCHGSAFDLSGKVISAPANIDLQSFTVEEKNENLIIYL